jgi:nucleoside-diphosphate-sugar epimerase
MSPLSDTKILIAGSNGFIGKHLCRFLSEKYKIFGIGNEDCTERFYNRVDLTKTEEVDNYVIELDNVDVLIFLTGLAHSKGKNKQYNDFFEVNVQTLINLLSCLSKYNKLPSKIIFSSTISIYGENWKSKFYNEEIQPFPKSPYAKTKLEAELYLLRNYMDSSWILRFSPVYAEDFKLNIDRRTKIRGKYYFVGKGKAKLSLLNIRNIEITVDSIIQNKIPSGIYNLADRKVYTYMDLLEYQRAIKPLRIPRSFMYLVNKLGLLTNNNFLIENSIKLVTDNIYSPNKILKFIDLNKDLIDIK